MAQIYDRFQIDNGHLFAQLIADTLLTRSFKALNRTVVCVYIDPPYNTGDSEIPYKNAYLRSSWLTLMASRLALVPRMFTPDPVLFIAIDDFEMVNLAKLIDREHSLLRREMIIVNPHPQGGKAKTLAHTHEYMIACVSSSSDRTLVGRMSEDGVEQRPFKRSGTAESNFRYGRPNSFYAVLIDPVSRKVKGLEPPPPLNRDYPTEPTAERLIRAYPIGANGDERVWRRSYESCLRLVEQEKLICTEGNTINLNREDGGRRKFILVEMGDYFDTVLLPRIKKVTFTPEWKDGKPKRLASREEAARSPRIVKVVRLESYEDALNNLETRRTEKQQLLLDDDEAQRADGLKEQYLLRYMLDVETRDSQSLLNVQAFHRPHGLQAQGKASRIGREPRCRRRSAGDLQLADRPHGPAHCRTADLQRRVRARQREAPASEGPSQTGRGRTLLVPHGHGVPRPTAAERSSSGASSPASRSRTT